MTRLPPQPELDWSDTLRARAFGDVYFSRDGGLAESEHVFLRGCGLPEAWRDKDRYAIGELGFGSGLNVLAVWRAWRATRKAHAQLHISTIEAFPLARQDAARALVSFPEVADLAATLLARWPARAYGPQRLWFPEDGFALTIRVGEAETVLAQMTGAFDAWFLDGFAPARNPAMWSDAVFRDVARLSKPGARAATFTVAGTVRRGLESAGFEVEKKPGFGAKRECLEARFGGTGSWAAPRVPKRVAVIGAGIAGAGVAAALVRRNIETIVLEAAPQLGAGASGNPGGIVMPRLDRSGALAEVFLAAYIDAIATYAPLGAEVFHMCGVEQRADPRNAEALEDLLRDPPLPEDWLGAGPNGAMLHKRGGVLKSGAAVQELLRGARVLFESPVAGLEWGDDGWLVRAPDGRAQLKADAVVLACGAALSAFEPARFLPFALSRGQMEWGRGAKPDHAITQNAYAAPFDGGVMFGATFDPADRDDFVEADAASREKNISTLSKLSSNLAAALDHSSLQSRAALRVTTPDFAPIAGLLPNAEMWMTENADVAHGAAPHVFPSYESMFVLGGLGARGLTLAPFLGECIAGEMLGEPALLSKQARAAIQPVRFLERALRRKR